MKKKQLDEQQVTTDVIAQPVEEKEEKSEKKKMSKLKKLSMLWTVIMFCIYVALDINKIVKNGWTALNIIVTVFLGLQILLFIIFALIGTTDKKRKQRQKATMKYVKKTRKITVKLLTVITSVMMIIGVESVNFGDVLAIIVAVISLLLMIFSLAISIKKQVRKSNKKKEKQQKLQSKQEKNK